MNARRPRLLRDTGDELLHLLAHNHHHVGKFVDYHHNKRQLAEFIRLALAYAAFIRAPERVGNGSPARWASRIFVVASQVAHPSAAIRR